MKYLLDTHILIWFLKGDKSVLSDDIIELIKDSDNEVYYSVASLWEVAIKYSKKPELIGISADNLAKLCEKADMQELPIKKEHVFALNTLKLEDAAPKHEDPFDRILVAQAKQDKIMLITHDSKIKWYNEQYIMIV